ncbi:MAG: MBL fold metallo-hydrolase [Acidobacteriota bacterium]
MPVSFRSLRSSSSGNCLALWTRGSSVLIDCGVRRQNECRDVLEGHQRMHGKVDAVLVSHAHGDHMSYASLRVLQKENISIHGHRHVVDQIHAAHRLSEWADPPTLRALPPGPFRVGDFSIRAIEVPHAPHFPNYGFVIMAGDRKVVICTDLHDATGLLEHFVDADFIFVEANHDLALLREHPNPSSHYHLNNQKTAKLLCDAVRQSSKTPSAVMLGHLSHQRNSAELAVRDVKLQFERAQVPMTFDLSAAPRVEPSGIIRLG